MRPYYSPARRPARRRTRVVNVAARLPSRAIAGLAPWQAQGWQAGIRVARLLRAEDPALFDRYVADKPATPEWLRRIASAWLSLVNAALPLDGFLENAIPITADPIKVLTQPYQESHEAQVHALQALSQSWDFLAQPWPCFYGLGVQSVVNGEEGNETVYSILTLALWSIFERTSIGLSARVAQAVIKAAPLTAVVRKELAALPRIPPTIALEEWLPMLVYPGIRFATFAEYVGYAHGATDNVYADLSSYEVSEIYTENDLTWDEWHELIEPVNEARKLSEAYSRWGWAVMIHPLRELRALGQWLASVCDPTSTSPYLIDILADELHTGAFADEDTDEDEALDAYAEVAP